jgi:benzoyl-CoA-dihydrodiol lyase
MGHQAIEQKVPSFETHPSRYRHFRLVTDGAIATLTMAIEEPNGLRDDYLLKQNSYDLGVDLELRDATERLRFEHPEVRAVIVTSAIPRIFCAGANIPMLATSTHPFKVNFCKYTNETRVGLEQASSESGVKFLAACNGTAAGGGYELALACDKIALIDDGNSAVSLPEVPLLGVLPGTGGLTRMVDKRGVRRDIADVFCTKAEGFRARDAVRTGVVDASFPRSKWESGVRDMAAALAAANPARATAGITLPPLDVTIDGANRRYRYVELSIDAAARTASITVHGPDAAAPATAEALRAAGASTWSFLAFRELHDALMHLRFNHGDVGLVVLRTRGDLARVAEHDAALHALSGDWFADEIRWYRGRVLRQVDNTARSLFAVIEPESCFGGVLFELALAADRSYMLADEDGAVQIALSAANGGLYLMATGRSRLMNRFSDAAAVEKLLGVSEPLGAEDALSRGLVTFAPDDIDWDDEVRIAIEERASISPDALTGMEQNLRFVGAENCETKIYGRLSAWQNWIFQRPNAVGETGALTLYGHPEKPRFDWGRT